MNRALPPIAKQPVSNQVAGSLPLGRTQAYIAVFEDALEQLAVLEDITPEVLKTDNKLVRIEFI